MGKCKTKASQPDLDIFRDIRKFLADLVTFAEEILYRKFHFLCSADISRRNQIFRNYSGIFRHIQNPV